MDTLKQENSDGDIVEAKHTAQVQSLDIANQNLSKDNADVIDISVSDHMQPRDRSSSDVSSGSSSDGSLSSLSSGDGLFPDKAPRRRMLSLEVFSQAVYSSKSSTSQKPRKLAPKLKKARKNIKSLSGSQKSLEKANKIQGLMSDFFASELNGQKQD